MILYEIYNTEEHPTYQRLQVSNLNRQYDFLRSLVNVAIDADRPFLSQTVIKALNFHAITCLHTNAGEYRPCRVTVGEHNPPDFFRVKALMDDFVNDVNRRWHDSDPVYLAAYVLWRLNWIHPFINGNGRTARVTCYFALCMKIGAWLPGNTVLPELIRQERERYVAALKKADASLSAGETPDLAEMHELLSELLELQLKSD